MGSLQINAQKLVGGNDELSVSVAAHAVDGARGASTDGVGVAARMFGGDGDRAICAANDGTFVVKRIGTPEVDDETGVLGTRGESDASANLNTESFVGLGVGDTRCRGGEGASAAPDIDCAGRGTGAAGVGRRADACGIGRGANVILDFLFGLLANVETSQKKRQDEQTGDCYKITTNFHWAPHAVEMGNPEPCTT